MNELAVRFMELFRGLDRAHGSYTTTGQKDENGKFKGRGELIKERVSELLWANHLDGLKRLGIVPIDDNNMVWWGCIDIDIYNTNLQALAKLIFMNKLPLVVARSKSGGAHIFCFVSGEVSAATMQSKLRAFAAFLGHGGSEIFPKQVEILKDRGDMGSWLNMPYYDMTKTVSYALDQDGNAMSALDFLNSSFNSRITPEALENYELPTLKAEMFIDGPPCLQTLYAQGLLPGMRNVVLANAAKYFKDKYPDDWKKHLEEFNSKLSEPLPSNEIQAMIKSRLNKDYFYQCKTEPLKSCCNAPLCRLRKFGVGGGADVVISSIRKFNVDPILWFLSLEGGGVVECNTLEMMNPTYFAMKCVDVTNKIPKPCKVEAWRATINEKLVDVTEINVPQEGTAKGQFIELLERFCTGRVCANTEDELLLGKPWTSEGRTSFKITGLLSFLDRLKFSAMKSNQVVAMLKSHPDLDCQHHAKHFNGKYCNFWSIVAFSAQTQSFSIKPKEEKKDVY